MKKTIPSLIPLLLSIVMLSAAFSSCGKPIENPTLSNTEDISESCSDSQNSESEDEDSSESEPADTTESSSEGNEEIEHFEGPYANLIQSANGIANTIQEYRSNAGADSYFLQNMNMKLEYVLNPSKDQLVSSIVNNEGNSYIQNTLDAFIRVKDGSTFYASKSENEASINTFRFGYYYDEFRIEGQNFVNGFVVDKEYKVDLSAHNKKDLKAKITNGVLKSEITGSDPYFSFSNINLPTNEYSYAQITLRTSDSSSTGSVYLAAGAYNAANAHQIVDFDILPADGEFHTYTVYLGSVKDYTGTLKSIRIDFNQTEPGNIVEVSDIKIINAVEAGVSSLSTARIFHIYPDKLHHELQVVAHTDTSDIDAIGVRTDISADTVDKIIVKDANGLHETLDKVDWDSAEYIGFDIKDAGIFGYILPVDETTGKMTVTLENGAYVIIQERTPENNTVLSGDAEAIGNTNDFHIGQRLYTDKNHTFDEFLKEAEIERHPLSAKNIKVSAVYSDSGKLIGYDALRGCYEFSLAAGSFNHNYYKAQNKHYELNFTVKSPDDRNIYILAASTGGRLESAALLDENLMMLPVPLEVCKNFVADGDNNIYDLLDTAYSEVIFPISLLAEEMMELNVLHLYQNWGNYPLKQLSSIEFYSPYYHLSVGVTETNCINFERPTSILPDHRALSAPLWLDQPQHTSGGAHAFLTYTDNDGNYHTTYNTSKEVDSYGPTYANAILKYLSTDNKIAVTLEHTEMPQTDENRAYYTIKYEFLEDMSFDNFKKQFNIYSVSDNDPAGEYQKFGYLNENNESVIVDAHVDGPEVMYILGDECPYFDYCDMKGYVGAGGPGYVNVSFVVCSSEIIVGGKAIDPNFIVREGNLNAYLSLNLDSVEIKAGDSITVNAIITPWGSQESDYSGADFAPDQNVRDIRENSAVDPFKVTAGTNTNVIESTFVPKVKSTNGTSAEFTISGGENNVAVRVYGFKDLAIPQVYEKIGNEWVEYEISSKNTPDVLGYRYNYDGYAVYYDDDGTFSYSFVTTMTDGTPRTFKMEIDPEFTKVARIPITENVLSPYNVYANSVDLARATKTWPMFSSTKTGSEGTSAFISIHGTPKLDEGRFPPFTNTIDATTGEAEIITGQYLVVKYRVPTTNPDRLDYIEFFASTVNEGAVAGDSVRIPLNNGFYIDGEWHVLVVDLANSGIATIFPTDEGTYKIKHVRFDVFNTRVSESTHVDLAYFALHDDLNDIIEDNSDMDEITLFKNNTASQIDTSTGESK